MPQSPPKKRAHPSKPREAIPPARRAEVLETALALIADHGVAGASLRKLAAELGMSQPSLYHYFESKEALVEQIVEYCAQRMLNTDSVALPTGREDIPRFCKEVAITLYASETHPRFVRFLFVVAFESEQNRTLIRDVFEKRLYPGFALLADAFGRDAKDREDLRQLTRMVVYAVGFPLLEERALFRAPKASAELLRYAAWVESAAERLLR